MAVHTREILLMAGVGVSLGLAATVLDATVFIPPDGQISQSDTELFVAEQAALEAQFQANLEELRRLEDAPGSPAQQWAEGVLASGQPLTAREMTTLSQIVNGGLGYVSSSPGYTGSSYGGGVSSRPVASSLSTSGSRFDSSEGLPRSYGASADLGSRRGYSDNVGTIDVRTGQYYAPAGTGYVNTQNGTYYAPSGPNGVVDTRTGAFIPTAP